jgi:hypothetical protein
MYRNLLRRLFPILLTALAAPAAISAPTIQDGTIIQSAVVTLKEADNKTLQASSPELASQLETIELRAITYLSDGLKVKGYLCIPRKGEKLPCVIWNRGGNRDSGD